MSYEEGEGWMPREEYNALAARLAEAGRIVRDDDQWIDCGARVALRHVLGIADSAPAVRITPEWLKQNPEYTCGCGLYVHPSRRNPAAIHIADCQFATDSAPACICKPVGAGDGDTYVLNPRCTAHSAPAVRSWHTANCGINQDDPCDCGGGASLTVSAEVKP